MSVVVSNDFGDKAEEVVADLQAAVALIILVSCLAWH